MSAPRKRLVRAAHHCHAKIAKTPPNNGAFYVDLGHLAAKKRTVAAPGGETDVFIVNSSNWRECLHGASIPPMRPATFCKGERRSSQPVRLTARASYDLARKPRPAPARRKNRAPDLRSPLNESAAARGRRRRRPIAVRALEAEQHDAATIRIVIEMARANITPGRRRRLAFQLPPIGIDADLIEPLDGRLKSFVIPRIRPSVCWRSSDQPIRARSCRRSHRGAAIARFAVGAAALSLGASQSGRTIFAEPGRPGFRAEIDDARAVKGWLAVRSPLQMWQTHRRIGRRRAGIPSHYLLELTMKRSVSPPRKRLSAP